MLRVTTSGAAADAAANADLLPSANPSRCDSPTVRGRDTAWPRVGPRPGFGQLDVFSPAPRLGVPRSTAKNWLRRGPRSVVTGDVFDDDAACLHARVLGHELCIQVLLAIVRLLLVVTQYASVRECSEHR